FSRIRFLAGANRAIQQESTFWRRSLWEKAGGYFDASLRMAGDFELWVRFFRHARLYPVVSLVGGYRMHADSLGRQNLQECYHIQAEIVEAELSSLRWGRTLRACRRVSATLLRTPKIGVLWRRLVIRSLYRMWAPDWPPLIEHAAQGWVMRDRQSCHARWSWST